MTRPLRILLTIHHALDLDAGAPGVTLRLGEEYARLGHEVELASFDDLSGRLPENVKAIAFPAYVAGRVVAAAGRRRRFDVVDTSTGDAWLLGSIRRQGRTALVVRSHGLEHIAHRERLADHRLGRLQLSRKYRIYRGGLLLWEVAHSLRRADAALFLNRDDRHYAVARLGVDPRRAKLVTNGIPPSFLNLPLDSEADGQALGIAQIGRYTMAKGAPWASRALSAVMSRHSNVHVTFLGTGCPRDEVLADFQPALRARVGVIPRYENARIPELLAEHEITLMASLSEGYPIAVLEAMACGLAPVVTSVGGPLELVTPGVNGLVVPPRDAAAIERSLECLVLDRHLRWRLRRAAHSRAQDLGWDAVAERQLEIYREILAVAK